MRIIQCLPTLYFGDAVGNNCRAIDRVLKEGGYNSEIYAFNIDRRIPKGEVKNLSELEKLDPQDILIYHMAIAINGDLSRFGGRMIIQYHNITPPSFYSQYSSFVSSACAKGLAEMQSYKNKAELCWADSEFNKADLIQAGYKCPIHPIPILVPFEDYEKPADNKTLRKYDDDYVNFLFVGRVVPNKAQEDIIRTFAWYQKHVNAKSRLFIIGNTDLSNYVERLKQYIQFLKLNNVFILGHISFSEILAYYKLADIFLCMSQHEGFCVPLLEAMYFHVPIVARNTTAIPYTLGGAGILLKDNDPVTAALTCDRILTDQQVHSYVIQQQDKRLEYFSYERIKRIILEEIKAFV